MPLCDQCEATIINGVKCHEQGCINAWKDEKRECLDCGYDFIPSIRTQELCSDCIEGMYNEAEADEEE